MKRFSLIARMLLPAVTVTLGIPDVVQAQHTSNTAAIPLDQSLQGPAKEAYAYARTLFDHGDFAGALAKYSQAYDLSKDPRLLFNMALCERNLRAYARMQGLLLRYKSESGAALSASDRSAVDAAIAASRKLVGKLTIRSSEADATVTVDGKGVGATPLEGPLALDLGKHAIVVRKDGFESVERSVEIAGGSQSSVDFTLIPRPPSTAHLVVVADQDALVAVDHQSTARGQFDGPVAAGAHEVDVTAPGRRAHHAELLLKGGETRSLHVTLEENTHGASAWPWIVGGVVVAAGAAVGSYFLLKTGQGSSEGQSGQLATVQFQLSGRR